MDTDADNRSIVRTIVALAHSLDLNLVAEGTETLEEVAELQQLECEYAQGYFFSRPIDPDAAERLLIAGLSGKRLGKPAIAAHSSAIG